MESASPECKKLKLLTPHLRLWRCDGGYQFANIANYEAKIALKMLSFPVFKVDYRSIPWAIFSAPKWHGWG